MAFSIFFAQVGEDNILYYINENNLQQLSGNNTSIIFIIGSNEYKKKYNYNSISNTILCEDISGIRYFNKDEERNLLLCELKQMYLKKIQNKNYELIQNNKYSKEILSFDDEYSQRHILKEKIENIDKVVYLITRDNLIFGNSFGEQLEILFNILTEIKAFTKKYENVNWKMEAFSMLEIFKQENPDFSKEKKLYELIESFINYLHIYENINKTNVIENSYYNLESNDILSGLLKFLYLKMFYFKKANLENELKRGQLIDDQIRDKKIRIRYMIEDFDKDYELTDDDETRYKRLINAQKNRTNVNYGIGLNKVKEMVEDENYKIALNCLKYDSLVEKKDVDNILQSIDNEFLRIKELDEQLVAEKENVKIISKNIIPILEEESNVVDIMIDNLERKLTEFNDKSKEYNKNQYSGQKGCDSVQSDVKQNESEIKNFYDNLRKILEDIADLESEISELKHRESQVESDEISAFKDTIFEKAGGQKKGQSDSGYVNHSNCTPNLPLGTTRGHCLYRTATDIVVQFALDEINNDRRSYDADRLLNYHGLESYTHSFHDAGWFSTSKGTGKHADDLRSACKRVFLEYGQVQDRIDRKKAELNKDIKEKERTLQKKKSDRDGIRNNIIDRENQQNKEKLKLMKFEKDLGQIGYDKEIIDSKITMITDAIDSGKSQKSSIEERLTQNDENKNDILYNISELEDSILKEDMEIKTTGDHLMALETSKTRWLYSQYEKMLNTFDLQSKMQYSEEFDKEMNLIDADIRDDSRKMKKLYTDLKQCMLKKKDISKLLQEVVDDSKECINSRYNFEKVNDFGLENSIQLHFNELDKLSQQELSEIKYMNQMKPKLIKRNIYNKLNKQNKGTSKADEDSLDLSSINHLYKKRGHKSCQDCTNNINAGCKYFDGIDFIINSLLQTEPKKTNEIFEELKSQHDNYAEHVLNVHKNDLSADTKIIETCIQDFNQSIKEIKDKYKEKRSPIEILLKRTKENLFEKKKLDQSIITKKLVSRSLEQDEQNIARNLDCGADFVSMEIGNEWQIYTSNKTKKNINECIQQITIGLEILMACLFKLPNSEITVLIKEELNKIIKSTHRIDVEEILMQKRKNTNKRNFYHILVHYLEKNYLQSQLKFLKVIDSKMMLKNEIINIERNIFQIKKNMTKLEKSRDICKKAYDLNNSEIKKIFEKNFNSEDLNVLHNMKALHQNLLKELKSENDERSTAITNFKVESKQIQTKIKSHFLPEHIFDLIKTELLKFMKEYPNSEIVSEFLDNALKEIQSKTIQLKPPLFNIKVDYQKKLFVKFQRHNFTQQQQKCLKKVCKYISEYYKKYFEYDLRQFNNMLMDIQAEISKLEEEHKATEKIIIFELEERIDKIENYITFKKTSSYLHDSIKIEDNVELMEYKNEYFRKTYNEQIEYLIKSLTELSNNMSNNDIKSESKVLIKSIILSVFTEYTLNLKQENILKKLNQKLSAEMKEENPNEKLRELFSKKSTKMAEYLLRNISWEFNQNGKLYNSILDPHNIYMEQISDENLKKMESKEIVVEKLKEEILKLEENKKLLYLQDNSLLIEELDHINCCLQYFENNSKVLSLKNRFEELNELHYNKDDYYSFHFDAHRVLIRFVTTESKEKCAELNEIDNIRSYLSNLNEKVLDYKVRKEKYEKDFEIKNDENFQNNFRAIQRSLFLNGVFIIGYDTFESGEVLNVIQSLIAIIITVLVQEYNLYQINGLNTVNERIEGWTRRIFSNYCQITQTNDSEENKNFELDKIKIILNMIYKEFKMDNIKISNLNVINSKGIIKFVLSNTNDSNSYSKNNLLTLLHHNNKFFALIPKQEVNISSNCDIDSNIKISYLWSILQDEEDLFSAVVKKRLENEFGELIEHTKNLVDFFKLEKKKLNEIKTIKEFLSIFCNWVNLKNHQDHSKIKYLFGYLSYMEEIHDEINENSNIRFDRCKKIKDLYEKAFIRIIKNEQARRNQNLIKLNESKEELYLKELIQTKEDELNQIMEEINIYEDKIHNDQVEIDTIIGKKEETREKYLERIEQLSNTKSRLMEKMKYNQEKIKELNKNSRDNQEKIRDLQSKVVKLERDLAEIDRELKVKEEAKNEIELEIRDLVNQKQKLSDDFKKVIKDRKFKENELISINKRIELEKMAMQLIENIQETLASVDGIQKKIKIIIGSTNDIKTIFEEIRTQLSNELWEKIIENIDYDELLECLDNDEKLGGEFRHAFVDRIKSVILNSMNMEYEIVKDIVQNKVIKRFKCRGMNISYNFLHTKIHDMVIEEIRKNENSRGINFVDGVLYCSEYGVTGIESLPDELKGLVEKCIEFNYRSEEIDLKKKATFKDAAEVVNKLQIDYTEVVRSYIDEIQVIASNKFILDSSTSYPGIDLTIMGTNMVCVGDNLILDTTGRDGKNFKYDASHGNAKRSQNNESKGDHGYDGYNGEHGNHGGNIIIQIKNEIQNLNAIKSVKANGGNGGEGQLGGNGDKGIKGKDGVDGKADDTNFLGGGQTCIGFGSPGEAGGKGGNPGKTGQAGLGGSPGKIEFEHKLGKITIGEANPGQNADNVLNKRKPSGGEGGDPGKFGMDEVKDKNNFFCKTETKATVVDRAELLRKYPQYREAIENSEKITCTNRAVLWGIILAGCTGGLIGAFWNSNLTFEEISNGNEYRDRQNNRENKKSQQNNEEVQLRSEASIHEDKRVAVNIDSLHEQFDEKLNEDRDISGAALYEEKIYDLNMDREQLEEEIELCDQEENNIKNEIQNVEAGIEIKNVELEKIIQDIESLQSTKEDLNNVRINKINQIIKIITQSQVLRDKTSALNIETKQLLGSLKNYNKLGDEFFHNKEDLIKILNEYLDALRARVRSNKNHLKYLRSEYATKSSEIKDLHKQIRDLQQQKLLNIEVEIDLEQEIQQEITTENEITTLMDFDENDIILKDRTVKKSKKTKKSHDCFGFEPKINQLVNDYRCEIINNHEFDSIMKKICADFKENEALITTNVYNIILPRIKINKNINNLNIIKKNFFNDYLLRIENFLLNDKLSNLPDDSMHQSAFLNILKDVIAGEILEVNTNVIDSKPIIDKLEKRFKGELLFSDDNLQSDIECLINIINDKRKFNFDFGNNFSCHELMIQFNESLNFDDLMNLVKKFSNDLSNLKNNDIKMDSVLIYIKNFIKITTENFKVYAILFLNSNNHNIIDKLENLCREIKIIKQIYDEADIIAEITIVEQILEIIKQYKIVTECIKNNSKSKRAGNRKIQSLTNLTIKIIKYIDHSSQVQNDEITNITKSFLTILKSEFNPDIDVIENVNDQFEDSRRLISVC